MSSAEQFRFGWLIVGHGTRNEIGRDEFHQLAQLLISRAGCPTRICFLELAEPTIAEGIAQLAEEGITDLIVVPLLLFSAGHAKEDIPVAVSAAATEFGLRVRATAAPLEFHPQLLALSQMRVEAALVNSPRESASLLLVGRGSSDPAAVADVNEYARRLGEATRLPARAAFVAAAKPSVRAALDDLAASATGDVLVVPHLLFTGEVLETIARLVEEKRSGHPERKWFLAGHLGPSPLVAAAVLDRAAEAERNCGTVG